MMKIVFGIDHGNGAVKLRSNILKETIPSVYASLDSVGDALSSKKINLDTYIIDEESYVWGKDISKVSDTISSYGQQNRYSSENYKILSKIILARMALKQNIKLTDEVIIMTGVPSSEIGTKEEDQIKDVYLGEHKIKVGDRNIIINVTKVIVKPQPVGTIMSLYLDDEGYIANEEYEDMTVGVIDIGSGTTDLDVITGLRREKESTSIGMGMQDIYTPILVKIKSEYKGDITTVDIENCFEVGVFSPSKRKDPIDFNDVKEKAIKRTFSHIVEGINKAWKTFDRFDEIIITGGGASVFGELLEQYIGKVTVIEDSQFANVEGYYRLGQIEISEDE